MDCKGLSWAVTDSQRILKYSLGFSQTVKGSARITWFVMDCKGLSWAVMDSPQTDPAVAAPAAAAAAPAVDAAPAAAATAPAPCRRCPLLFFS
jgi:hypothetical protein